VFLLTPSNLRKTLENSRKKKQAKSPLRKQPKNQQKQLKENQNKEKASSKLPRNSPLKKIEKDSLER
jgi:hypothetical protein